MDTLVLSNTYIPITRVPWQRAITLVLLGRVEVLEEYDDRIVRSVSEVFHVPSVIRFIRKVTGFFHRQVRFNRKNVWLRDKGCCQYCGTRVSMSDFTYDHVIPQSQGGKTTWENVVVSCMRCNQKKRDRTPKQAGMTLVTPPIKPKSLPSADLSLSWGQHMPESWKDYLGSYTYWHGALND